MNTHECPFLTQTLRSAKTNRQSDELAQHLNQCSICRQELLLSRAMAAVQAETYKQTKAIPAPKLIWLKAQFNSRQEKLSTLDLIKLLGLSLLGALICIAAVYKLIFHGTFPSTELLSGASPIWLTLVPFAVPVVLALAVVISLWVFSLELFYAKR